MEVLRDVVASLVLRDVVARLETSMVNFSVCGYLKVRCMSVFEVTI